MVGVLMVVGGPTVVGVLAVVGVSSFKFPCNVSHPQICRRKHLGAGDVIQVSQHIHSIVQQALTFKIYKSVILHVCNHSKYCLTTQIKRLKAESSKETKSSAGSFITVDYLRLHDF